MSKFGKAKEIWKTQKNELNTIRDFARNYNKAAITGEGFNHYMMKAALAYILSKSKDKDSYGVITELELKSGRKIDVAEIRKDGIVQFGIFETSKEYGIDADFVLDLTKNPKLVSLLEKIEKSVRAFTNGKTYEVD